MVSASSLGQYVFCAESARLAALGARPNSQARQRMAAGEMAHDRWQRQQDRAPRAASRAAKLAVAAAILFALLAFLVLVLGG